MKDSFFKNSFVYVLGDVFNKAIPFLLLPVLTRYLTPSDYGIIASFTVIVSIFSIFAGLSIHGSINVNFFKMEKSVLKEYIGNCILLLNVSTFLVLIISILFHTLILKHLLISAEWLFVAIIMAFSQFLITINLTLWIAEQKPKIYSIYQILQTLLIALVSLFLIIGLNMNWEGQLLATVISTVFFGFISFLFIIKRGYIVFKPNIIHIKDALKFGVPLIPHALSGWIKTSSDRLLIISTIGLSAAGIYSISYQIGLILSVIVVAFNKAWSPFMFKKLSSNPTYSEKVKIVKFTYLYFIIVLIIAFLLGYLLPYFIPILLGERFIESSNYLLFFFIAFAFDGMYFMVGNYILFMKKTHILALVTFSSAIIHLLLLYFLIKINGILGAAQAMMLSYIVTFLMTWYLSSKVYQMPWLFWRKND